MRIVAGIRPDRPVHPGLTDELWDLNQRCWHQEPLLRPGASEVVSHLRNALTAQGDHADTPDASTTCGTISSSQGRKPPPHCEDSFPSLPRSISQKYISGLKGLRRETTHSTPARWLLALRTPPRKPGTFDEVLDVESNPSGDALHYYEFVKRETPPHRCNPPSGIHGFLKKAAFWFSDRRAQDSRGHSGSHQSG